MKRVGHLFGRVCSFEALTSAAYEAAKGKKKKARVAKFLQNIETEVIRLEQELLSRTCRPRPYRTFMIHDPKERMICAADFRDRVVHHAVCRVLEPIFEKSFIYDTYACRKDKGAHRAARRAQVFSRSHGFFLKLDVYKFFDSVDHAVLKTLLRRKVKDPELLWLLDVFIDCPVPWTENGKGIPIGNLTSQNFANFYLSGLDHFIKEYLRVEGYVRYMDDLVLFADEKETLWDAAERIEGYLGDELRLQIKPGALLLAPVSQGLPFLGLRIFPGVIRISRQGWRRFRRKVGQRDSELISGHLDRDAWARSMASLVGHMQQANTRNLRASFFQRPGVNEA
ncbi:MAG: RNA-directed DNA polymerase [Pseudomonadota bacterium]